MELSAEQEAAVLAKVEENLTRRAWEKLEGGLEEVTCISVQRLAGMLDISTAQTRRVLEETIDFGPRDARVSLAQARRLVDARTSKKRK